MGVALQFFMMYECESSNLISQIVTWDENWPWYTTLDRKESCKEWHGAREYIPTKLKTELNVCKLMATVFWDVNGILSTYYLKKTCIVSSLVFTGREFLFTTMHHPHKACPMVQLLQSYYWTIFNHLQYSPPAITTYLLPLLEELLCSTCFNNNEELKIAVRNFFQSKTSDFYWLGIEQLVYLHRKCIELKGKYVNK